MVVACPSHFTPRLPAAKPTHVTNGNAPLKEHTLLALVMPYSLLLSLDDCSNQHGSGRTLDSIGGWPAGLLFL
ncbi:unnamed protein product [Hymenolepis diminuta]|uniref:Uncharacterized protein n=1 Tax=Hymenolepis diminuta TaxID=6216 RepID=A0A0R3SSU0_HYMDI|nr:unnamed protein product [Hymenolepis diminuta]